jgi:hypothetical protein
MMSRRAALALWNPRGAKLLRWRGYVQAFTLWPIYSIALVSAMLRMPVGHIATPKVKSGDSHLWLVIPHVALFGLLLCSILWRVGTGLVVYDVMPIAFAAFAGYVQTVAVRNATAR